MRQRLVSIDDDYFIENELGQRVFFVDGKAFRICDHLAFKDMQGHELATVQEAIAPLRDAGTIYRQGQLLARVKKALLTPVRGRFNIQVADGSTLNAQGNVLVQEYVIQQGRLRVAEISKRWFRAAGTYGVEIARGADEILILASTVVIDMLANPL
jgi:uncharacterized protein YxjI